MTSISISQARSHLSDIANRVAYAGQRICIERNGSPLFALVPFEDLQMLEALEDKIDLQAAKAALKKKEFTDLEKLAKELGV